MGSVAVPAIEVLKRTQVRENVHREHAVALVQEELRVVSADGQPPLFVERSHLPGGPTRSPVILVHGFAQNRFTWRVSQRSLQARLAEEGYDVWNLELRGHGRSRGFGAGNARNFEEYVRDVARVATLCGAPPFLMGHSLGAAACVGAATEVDVAGLINLAGVFTFARNNRTLRALAALSLAWEPVLTAAPFRMSTGWAGDLIGRLYSISDIAGYGFPIAGWTPDSIERDVLEERLRDGFDWTSIEVWLQMCRWARGEELAWSRAFGEVDIPLLVLMGDHDMLAAPVDGRACLEASGSRDRTMIVFDAWNHKRHWGHLDLVLGHTAPQEVWPQIVSWLNARS